MEMTRHETARNTDYEELGFRTILDTRGDERSAKEICGFHLDALAQELRPEMQHIHARLTDKNVRGTALTSQMYDRRLPVSDSAMLTHRIKVVLLAVLFLVVFVASAVSNAARFVLFGWTLLLAALVGLVITAAATAGGHLLYERLLARHRGAQAVIVALSSGLLALGLVQLAQAGSSATDAAFATSHTGSYVDEPAPSQELTASSSGATTDTNEQSARKLLGSATVKIMLAMDAMVGLLLGVLMRLRADDDFAAWSHVKTLKRQIAALQLRHDELAAELETARRKCAAGVLRGLHFVGTAHPPYFKMLPVVIAFTLLGPHDVAAQGSIQRAEGILLDSSRTMSHKGSSSHYFDELLAEVRHLLGTEPPDSRVWVQLIGSDSFGGSDALVHGWTPGVAGVFSDDLDRARMQLLKKFDARATAVAPSAQRTDIIGALWRIKTSIEAAGDASQKWKKELYILSDGLCDTKRLNMAELLPYGEQKMLEIVRAEGMLVPLAGYRIRFYGASMTGHTPATWNAMRRFWTSYFRSAGAELVMFSPATTITRDK